ncbi:hypothetical protein UPYG_G00083260 [Umbra pygmaea]|uniref:Uncharacterized protein n=1 Tax=Umbra pygmaea TaxID=75934 RepID=A0ABD0Y1J3_UMBPY
MEATFTVKSVNKTHTGNYSCVLDLQSKPLMNTTRTLCGNNEEFLQVNETSLMWMSWTGFLISSLILGIWLLIRKQGAVQSCSGRISPNDDVAMPEEGNTSNVDEQSSDEFSYDSVEDYGIVAYQDVGIDDTYHEIEEILSLTSTIPVTHSSRNVPLTGGGQVRRKGQS